MVAPHLEKLLDWFAHPSAYSAFRISVLLIFLEKILLVIGVKLETHRPHPPPSSRIYNTLMAPDCRVCFYAPFLFLE